MCFSAFSFVLSFLFIDFAVMGGFNLGFTISYFALFALATVYLFRKDVKQNAFTYICGALSLLGAVTFALFSDTLIRFLMLFLVFGLFCAYCCLLSGTAVHSSGSYKVLFDFAAAAFRPVADISRVSKALGKSAKGHKNAKSVLVGMLVAVPFLLVIIPLLVKSDAAFQGLVTSALADTGKYILEILAAAVITPYVVSFLYGKRVRLCPKAHGERKGTGRLQSAFTISFLSVISLTYIVYLFSQLAYFFSTFSGILPAGWVYSASAFARRGFFEMFFICAVNFAVLFLAGVLTKRHKKGKLHPAVRALSLFILLFSVLLIITAMSKMKLNIEIYGLSKNRLLVSVFMALMLAVAAVYIMHLFVPKVRYMQGVILLCSAVIIALAFADVDAVVAKYNVWAYQNAKIETVDVDYLGSLSDSAVPYILALAEDDALKDEVDTVLSYKALCTELSSDTSDFRSFNYSTQKAAAAVSEYFAEHGTEFEQEYDEYDAYDEYGGADSDDFLSGV